MSKDKQIENIKNIDIPEYQLLTITFSAIVSAIIALLMSPHVPKNIDNPLFSPKLLVAFGIPVVAFVSLLEIFTFLEAKLTKTSIETKDEKLIKFDDDSFVITDKLSNRRNVGFSIKNGEHKIVGHVLPSDIKLSKENFSYVNEITTEQTSTIFHFSNKAENKKYLLYLSPTTFDSVKNTFID